MQDRVAHLLVGTMRRDDRREDRGEHQDHDDAEPDHAAAVLAKWRQKASERLRRLRAPSSPRSCDRDVAAPAVPLIWRAGRAD